MNSPFQISLRNISQPGQVLMVVSKTYANGKVNPEYISQQMPADFAAHIKAIHEAALAEGDSNDKPSDTTPST